ncbi:uncharacterized protein PHALS_04073 [Plasmopara halstedii]|uniref:Uncharacterized protein n=1 Tax=Plasmopara halstedii TaxID=4781 RepID=A0A0P1A921_PLAHL|nr:uncharacterized protein PHALS_04073 [Plasmopara halstedii]CEG36816.1 hypothetical protein PHALS_04073 [Plasmopara halstedii]|eukprot:XP_024573185.1 hypothetical protein PHALS_04073 [Plasmopara halstedii]
MRRFRHSGLRDHKPAQFAYINCDTSYFFPHPYQCVEAPKKAEKEMIKIPVFATSWS